MINEVQEIAKKNYSNRIRIRVCGICIENEQVLMVCHKGVIDNNDVWLPPGGGMEEGETMEETLIREFIEETGFEVKVENFLFKNEFIHSPIHAIELYFGVKIKSGKLIKGIDPESDMDNQLIKDVRWVHKKDRDFFREDIYLAINS